MEQLAFVFTFKVQFFYLQRYGKFFKHFISKEGSKLMGGGVIYSAHRPMTAMCTNPDPESSL